MKALLTGAGSLVIVALVVHVVLSVALFVGEELLGYQRNTVLVGTVGGMGFLAVSFLAGTVINNKGKK